ncbi:MAG: AMP-binding protein [Treponema sp.]|jgi:long-chain acyl-CoA synthetase|nr:AMP-binding protein [Treponema sp.]
MMKLTEYWADWPDMPYPNFIAFLDDAEAKWRNKTALFYRSGKAKEFTQWSYTFFVSECKRIARGLLAAGLKKGDRVALWAENRPEWMAAWMGVAISGMVIVPIDFLVSEKECSNILRITGARGFFYSEKKKDYVNNLTIPLDIKTCVSDSAFAEFGTDSQAAAVILPSADSIAERDPVSIVFTSGTTGFAKGVTLHHKGIIANASAAVRSLRALSSDVFINVLPLHHTYPTTCSFISPLSAGAGIIIVEKLIGKVVVDDIHDAGGTFLIAVPLLYDKVMVAIDQGYQKLARPLKVIFNFLRKISLAEAKKGRVGFGRAALSLVRHKARLGSIRMMVAGGGPLNPKTADFFDSFGFNMVHGYGMSENSPLISVNTPWHRNNVSVGLPVKHTDVKIFEPNEEGVGEIIVRSPSLMLGYHENPEATMEMFTEDGWLKTGDLGYIDDLGFIYISGRKKNLIVSSGGKNIYPEEIEAHFSGSRVIGEVLVVGRKEPEHGGEHIFAVVVPNYEAFEEDHGKGMDEASIRELIKKEIEEVNRSLVGYKKIMDFTVRKEPFEKNAQQKIRRFLYKSYEEA